MTQQDVAVRLNQSVTTYKGWEQDRSKPRTFAIISKLCALLHITIDHYINGCENLILSPEQQQLLGVFEQCDADIQLAVMTIMKKNEKR